MKAYWTEGVERVLVSEQDVRNVINEVQRSGKPTMLFVEHDTGRMLALGLGGQESVLTFVDTDGTSFHSVGDISRSGVLKFWCRDQVDDFMAEMAVPESVAIDAALAFAATGTAPPNITWEPDW